MRTLSPVLTTVFLASIVLQCYTQSTCTSGDCIFDCSQQDCTEIVCTDGADSCTIVCGTNECYGSIFYLAATINTVECDGSASCKLASFFCGEPPPTAPVWARWSPASFDGHIHECTFRLSNSAMSDQGRIRCYHAIDVCQVSALTDADDFKVSQFECELSPVDAQCRMFCHTSKSCGSGTSSFACQAPECDCSGPGCSQLMQTMDTAPPSTSTLGTTVFPTSAPTCSPSSSTVTPTMTPTLTPTSSPSRTPTTQPTLTPTLSTTTAPSNAPTLSIPILETLSPTAVTSTSAAATSQTTTSKSATIVAVVSLTTTTTVTAAATTAVIVEQTGTNDSGVGHGGSNGNRNDGDTILLPDSVLSKISLITIGLVAMCGSLLVIVCVLRKKRKRNLEQKQKQKQATQTGHGKQALPSITQLPAPVPRDRTTQDEAEPGAVTIAMTSTRRNDSLYTNPHRNTAAAPVNVTAEGADHAHLPPCPPHITIHHTLQPTVYQRRIRELRPQLQDHLQRMAQLTTGDVGGECGGDDAEAADIDRDPSICDDEKLSRCSRSHTTDAAAAAKNVITPRTLQYDEHESSDDDAAVLAVASHSKLHKRGATISHKSMQSFANSRVSMPSTPSVPSVPSMHDCLHSEVIRRQGSTDEMYDEHGHEQEEEAVHVTVDMNGVLHTQGHKSHLADVDVDIDLEEDECDKAMEDMYTSDNEQSVKTPG